MLEKLHAIKKARIKLDVLDLTRIPNVTARNFWIELDRMVELNFENPATKKKALDSGLEFDVILPESASHSMYMEVLFDGEGSIEIINFDPGNSAHDSFCNLLGSSRIMRNVVLGLT